MRNDADVQTCSKKMKCLNLFYGSLPTDEELAAQAAREEKSMQIDTKKQRAMKKLETVMVPYIIICII